MAGTYSDIVEIVAPTSARAGELVPVNITIKNIWTDYLHVNAFGIWDSVERFINFVDWIPAGSTHIYYGSFIMPDRDVTIHAYSYIEDIYGNWLPDDEAAKGVSLAEVFEGTISRKELKYDNVTEPIPIR